MVGVWLFGDHRCPRHPSVEDEDNPAVAPHGCSRHLHCLGRGQLGPPLDGFTRTRRWLGNRERMRIRGCAADSRLEGVRVDPSRVRVHVPGSAGPLVRNLVIFSAKYCLTAAMIIAPTLHDSLARWDIWVSGISAGYFIGGLLRLVIKIRGAWQPKSEALIA
jgi:hypothetical protein